ncbi:MAG: universal stress protein [Bacteroidota bacterium]|nr:universal stress protein [Bacteroidota bacterium]MDP4246145.1 universal stress protein [Bacteroidota bacterium]MDP4256190.1 universal stress protein [Bacteroidota bacterium]MDP4259554.1 universal stress protein [Bacteroidota bacterium]
MEKILLALDGRRMDQHAVEFACYLAKLTKSKITAVFLRNLTPEQCLVIEESDGITHFEEFPLIDPEELAGDEKACADNIALFRDMAREEGVPAMVHLEKNASAAEVAAETRFADLLVLDASTHFSGQPESRPTAFVREILKQAECPVLVAPEKFFGIENVVFCYDGSKSSVFAIKQFSYLFPQWKGISAKVLYLNGSGELSEEERLSLTDWLGYHFRDVQVLIPRDGAANAFIDLLVERRSDIVVMGAYGRGLLDSFFQNEFVSDGAGSTTLPIFISHY